MCSLSLKTKYMAYLKELGSTRAGLNPASITKGSPIANIIGNHQLYYYMDQIKTFHTAGICNEWPWWDNLHTFWHQLPNYNPQGIQSSDPGTMHASDAATLFASQGNEDEDFGEGDLEGVDELDVDNPDSRGGSLVGEDEDVIPLRFLLLPEEEYN